MPPSDSKVSLPPAEVLDVADPAGEFFDRYANTWNAFYTDSSEQPRAYDFINRQQQLLSLVDEHVSPDSRILEFGCGAGHTALRLIEAGHELTCLDVSPQMIAATEQTLDRAGRTARLHVGHVTDDAVLNGELFDAIVGMGVMEYLPDHVATLSRLYQLTAPGGVCLLSFPNAFSPIRCVERLAKRGAAIPLAMLTRSQRYRDIAFKPSKLHWPRRIRRKLEQAGFEVVACKYLTYGLRIGGWWLPPLTMVRRFEKPLASSPFAWLGRNYIFVARKEN